MAQAVAAGRHSEEEFQDDSEEFDAIDGAGRLVWTALLEEDRGFQCLRDYYGTAFLIGNRIKKHARALLLLEVRSDDCAAEIRADDTTPVCDQKHREWSVIGTCMLSSLALEDGNPEAQEAVLRDVKSEHFRKALAACMTISPEHVTAKTWELVAEAANAGMRDVSPKAIPFCGFFFVHPALGRMGVGSFLFDILMDILRCLQTPYIYGNWSFASFRMARRVIEEYSFTAIAKGILEEPENMLRQSPMPPCSGADEAYAGNGKISGCASSRLRQEVAKTQYLRVMKMLQEEARGSTFQKGDRIVHTPDVELREYIRIQSLQMGEHEEVPFDCYARRMIRLEADEPY